MNNTYHATAQNFDTSINAGLRSFMLGVYNKLAMGIALAGALAYFVGSTSMGAPIFEAIVTTPLGMVVQWGPIALILASAFFIRRPTPFLSGAIYWSIVILLGLSLSFWMYAASAGLGFETRGGRAMSTSFITITKAFLVTASAFASLSLFGYTTKRNITGIGNFLGMALWGLVIIGIVSAFFPPSGIFEIVIQVGVLAVCAGLTATDTQQLKESYFVYQGDEAALSALSNHGALNFFLLFYNMFTIILSFMSQD